MICPNRPEPRAEAVHVVHEIEGVDDSEYPQNGNGVAKDETRHKERNARAAGGDQNGNQELANELRAGPQLVLIV